MNHCYRIVWSHLLNTWVAVAEIARSRGKSKSSVASASISASALPLEGCTLFLKPLSFALALALVPTAFAAPPAANALPTGGVRTAGQVTFSSTANVMDINQASQRAVVRWDSFDIGSNATVNIHQINKQAVLLNQIQGSNASQIYGKLNANGHVFLLNPSGTYFAPGSQINVGGLLASTLHMDDNDFMAGNYKLSSPGGGIIEALGSINADSVALVGNNVANSGSIIATTVSLISGNKVAIDIAGNNLIRARIEDPALQARISNSGSIQAATVTMSTGQAKNALNSVVNNSGTIRATALMQKGGEIYLTGTNVSNTGTLDASGNTGGGTIMLMGDMATGHVYVNGTLKAEATTSGNGGFIETSSAHVHIADGTRVSTRASNGKSGTWLIDPIDFTISSGGAAQTTSGIGATTLESALNAGSVTIQTDASTGGNGDIFINANIHKTSAIDSTLTLRAHRDIFLNNNVIIDSTSSKLGITFVSNISDTSGMIRLNLGSQILSHGGDIVFTGGSTGSATSGFAQGRDNTSTDIYGNGIFLDNSSASGVTINSSGGNITMRGKGAANNAGSWWSAGLILTGNIDAGTGKINLLGVANGASAVANQRDWGINMQSVNITSANAAADAITITGDASGSLGTNQIGIAFYGTNTIDTTAGGGMTIAGIKGTTAGTGFFNVGTIGSAGTTGDITIIADTIANMPILQSSGTLTIKPHTAGTTIGIGGGAGTLQIGGELTGARILNGFSNITIGDANTGDITANVFNFRDNLTLVAGATNADVTLTGAIASTGGGALNSLTVHATRDILGGTASITTLGGNVSMTADTGNVSADQITTGFTPGTVYANANGGNINITATSGNIAVAHGLDSSVTGVGITVGHAGNVALTASGNITQATSGGTFINAGVQTDGNGTFTGDGGNVALNAGGYITVGGSAGDGNIVTSVTKYQYGSTGAHAGDINVTSSGSNVTLTNLYANTYQNDSGGTVGNGGNVTVSAQGNIAVTDINTSARGSVFNYGSSTAVGNGGAVNLAATGSVVLSGAINTAAQRVSGTGTVGHAGDVLINGNYLNIAAAASISARNAVLSSATGFVNGAGAGLMTSLDSGRWLVYAANPGSITKGGLTSSFRHYNSTYASYAPGSVTESGNGFIYASSAGVLTVDTILGAGIASHVYGDTPTATLGYTLSGTFADSEDNASNIGVGGAAIYTNAPTAATHATSFNIDYSSGLTSTAGYTFNTGSNLAYTVTPKTVSVTGAIADNKVYDGATAATLSSAGSLAGLVGTETLTLGGYSAAFTDKNAASGKTVNINGYTITNGSGLASDYVLAATTATTTADITPKALALAGFNAANKTYDGNTTATIVTVGSLSGVIGGDTVTAAGGGATFIDKNAGVSKTVTLSGVSIAGADAANYSIASTITGSADITPKNLTVSGVAGVNKVYDSTTTASVIVADDRIAGDVLAYTSTANFDTAEAGSGKTVTVNALALTGGVDLGNYSLLPPALPMTTSAGIAAVPATTGDTPIGGTSDEKRELDKILPSIINALNKPDKKDDTPSDNNSPIFSAIQVALVSPEKIEQVINLDVPKGKVMTCQ